jgi:transcription initiation factor TFIIA small subunit
MIDLSVWLTHTSIGAAMTDALDQFISEGKMAPQVAIKMLQHFDRIVAEVLAEKVKSRLSFKVAFTLSWPLPPV